MKRSSTMITPGGAKRRTYTSASTRRNLALRVAKLESQTEWKSKDFYKIEESGTFIWNGAGSVTPIFELASGSGPDERVGRKVTVKSIQLQWGCLNRTVSNTSGTAALVPVRTMIVYDKQPTT